MTHNAESDIAAAVNLCLISPIPIAPKKSAGDFLSASSGSPSFDMPLARMSSSSSRSSPNGMASNWVSPSFISQQRQSLTDSASKSMISSAQRSDMSREVHHIIRLNLPSSIRDTTTLPQLILVSRAIEKKLYQSASSYNAYLNKSSLKLRIAALACAVLIHSEDKSLKQKRSETCLRLLAAARTSLPHCIMVLVSYETRQLNKEFAGVSASCA